MNLANIIAALQSGMDPNQAVIQASMPGSEGPEGLVRPPMPVSNVPTPGSPVPLPQPRPPEAGPAAPPAEPPPTTPEGAKTPVTNPAPAAATPTAVQSPPDLANMYIKLMQQNQNAAAMDSGLTLVAAGLTPSQETRQALIGLAGRGGGGGAGSSITSADLINLQKQQQSMKDMLLRRSILGGLAKQYGLSNEAAIALETSGKLDEVIAAHQQGHLQKVEDAATGQVIMVHPITGKEIVRIGGAKPPQGVQVKTEEGPTVFADPQTGKPIGDPIGGPKPVTGTTVKTEEGPTVLVNPQTGAQIGGPIGGLKQIEKEVILREINKTRPPDKQMTMEELVKLTTPQGTSVYVSPDGSAHPAPQPGFDWKRTKDGKVWIDPETGVGVQVPVSTKTKGEAVETEVDIKKKQKEAADALKKEHKERAAAAFTASNVGDAVDTALSLADKPGATGTFAKWGRTLSPVTGMSWDTIDAKLKTIDANNVVNALNAMRAASQSGGALGNVTENENKMLASIIASVSPYQETKEFKKGLIRIKAAMMVMAEDKYDDAEGAARFAKDLRERVDELTVSQANKGSGGKSNIQLRNP